MVFLVLFVKHFIHPLVCIVVQVIFLLLWLRLKLLLTSFASRVDQRRLFLPALAHFSLNLLKGFGIDISCFFLVIFVKHAHTLGFLH